MPNAMIHHVARRDDIGARLGVGHRFAREQVERGIVVHVALGREQAAVAMIGVLTHAHVGHHQQLRILALDRAHRFGHGTVRVPRRRARRVFRIGNAEEQDAANARVDGALRILEQFVDARLEDARHGADGRTNALPRAHEERPQELRTVEPRFAHDTTQCIGAAQTAQANGFVDGTHLAASLSTLGVFARSSSRMAAPPEACS